MAASLGLTHKQAGERLGVLLKRSIELQEAMEATGVDPYGDSVTTNYLKLRDQLNNTRAAMREIRDWYSLRVLETLESSASRLNGLTFALMVLTAVLIGLTISRVLPIP